MSSTDDLTQADDAHLDAELDETGPTRRCIVSGERQAPERMIRFVLGPDGVATPDLACTLPGRGAWVSATRAALDKASKGAFAKAFKQAARAPDGLASLVEAQLVQRLVGLLGLARRAGELTLGFTKVEAALAARPADVDCLIVASDSGPADRGKLLQAIQRAQPSALIIGLLTSAEISLAFGRENVVHACVKGGGLATRMRGEAGRLAGFRDVVPKDWVPKDWVPQDSAPHD